jgi:predicted DNA-binding protein (UPF0251 family)
MPNLLNMADIQAIWALAQQGWSQRRIARELGIDRETVARYLAMAKPAISHTGSDAEVAPKPAISHTGSEPSTEGDDGLLAGMMASHCHLALENRPGSCASKPASARWMKFALRWSWRQTRGAQFATGSGCFRAGFESLVGFSSGALAWCRRR